MTKQGCKPKYRKQYLNSRDFIGTKSRNFKARQMLKNFLSLQQYHEACVIHAFVSFGSEISTKSLIENAWQDNKQVVCPVTDKKNQTLHHHLVTSWQDFVSGYAGILEPKQDLPKIEISKFDLVLVPGMVFDPYGFRMGYGGGYYDRFLPRTKAIRIAPAFEEQIIDCVPHCKHDQQVDLIVTDKRIIECDRSIRPECPVKTLNEQDCPEL